MMSMAFTCTRWQPDPVCLFTLLLRLLTGRRSCRATIFLLPPQSLFPGCRWNDRIVLIDRSFTSAVA